MQKKLCILELQGYLAGGSAIHTAMLSKGLQERGHKVILAGPNGCDERIKNLIAYSSLRYEIIPFSGRYDWYSIYRLIQIIQEEKVDIVHTHNQNADFLGGIAARLARNPLVVTTIHGIIPNPENLRTILNILALRHLPHKLIAISQAVRERAIFLGVAAEKITVIYNASDISSFHVPTHNAIRQSLSCAEMSPLLAVVGHLEPSKGIDVAIQAFPIILNTYPDTRMIVIGEGSQHKALEELAHSLNVADKVFFLGFRSDAVALMSEADVVINPSKVEGFGRVNTEAMSVRKPVVCSDIPAFREIVLPEMTGILIPPGDPISLAFAINRLIASPEIRQRMGEAGWQRVTQEFSVERFIARTEELFTTQLESERF